MQANCPGASRIPNNHIQRREKEREGEENFVVACFSPPQNEIRYFSFTSYSCSDGKAMYKKATTMHEGKVLALPIQPIAFLTFILTSPSWPIRP